MASAIALPNLPDTAKVRILNPPPGGSTYTSAKRARRFVAHGRAYIDATGRLVFNGTSKSQAGASLVVSVFSGCDAFPGRAVLPPSGTVLARLESHGRAVRPPVRSKA